MRIRAIGLAALLLLAACQPSGPAATSSNAGPGNPAKAEQSAEMQRLIAAAQDKHEKQLDLSWSEDTLGGSQGAKKFEALFNQMYGLGIKVNFTPGPTMTDMSAKVTLEAAAGRSASTDILVGNSENFASLLDKKALEEYDYRALSPRVSQEMLASKNIGVQIASRFPGITYNTNLVPAAEVPKKLEDLSDPKWKGKIASTVNAASFDGVAFRPEWSPEKMKAFASRLSRNLGGLVRGGEISRIATGEFVLVVFDGGSYQARIGQLQGMPIKHVVLEDAAIAIFHYLGVPRAASHPNLAKLFIGMMLSEEGQRLLYDIAFYDHSALPGSRSITELSDLKAKRIDVLVIDPKFTLEHPEAVQLRDELTKILRQRSGG